MLVPIARGFPGPELWAAAERGEVVLGGCLVGTDEESLACPHCSRRPVGDAPGAPRTIAEWHARGEAAR